ncbi:MAG: hypothetical protein FJX54_11010 [Alphaproteobacteria bacterium]|nr:hypothetical protein [Alphaproteobacteria bacterium]
MIRSLLVRLTALLAVAAPAAAQGIASDPISRTFRWPDMMAGNDIKRACGPGAPERWRFVYNAIYSEQVRSYDIADGTVETRVFNRLGIGYMTTFSVAEFITGALSTAPISAEDLRRLTSVWEADLPRAVKPVGHLRADRFFWTTAGCRDGRFTFAAFNYPPDASTPFNFPLELARFDRSGRPGNPPRPMPDVGPLTGFIPSRHNRADDSTQFLLKVTENGLQFGY